jgi:four helix bundle protein
MHPYKRLVVWQRAHALAVALYDVSALDESPRYRAIVDQVRRCAGSIAANIAEGAGSDSQSSFARYLGIALASAHELESHLLLAREAGCASPANSELYVQSVESIKRMLTVLHRNPLPHKQRRRLDVMSRRPPAVIRAAVRRLSSVVPAAVRRLSSQPPSAVCHPSRRPPSAPCRL